MSLLIAYPLIFSNLWRQAASAYQNKHRFLPHSQEELESFKRMLERRSDSSKRSPQ
jgi:hypothetical protein